MWHVGIADSEAQSRDQSGPALPGTWPFYMNHVDLQTPTNNPPEGAMRLYRARMVRKPARPGGCRPLAPPKSPGLPPNRNYKGRWALRSSAARHSHPRALKSGGGVALGNAPGLRPGLGGVQQAAGRFRNHGCLRNPRNDEPKCRGLLNASRVRSGYLAIRNQGKLSTAVFGLRS